MLFEAQSKVAHNSNWNRIEWRGSRAFEEAASKPFTDNLTHTRTHHTCIHSCWEPLERFNHGWKLLRKWNYHHKNCKTIAQFHSDRPKEIETTARPDQPRRRAAPSSVWKEPFRAPFSNFTWTAFISAWLPLTTDYFLVCFFLDHGPSENIHSPTKHLTVLFRSVTKEEEKKTERK